jgi:uncharacterized membrane protein YedE/YeeE
MSAVSNSNQGVIGLAYSAGKSAWLAIAALLVTSSLYYVWSEQSAFEAQLLLLGMGLGLCLYHASFGFTTAWRNLIVNRDATGLRAQLVMLSISVLLFFPVLGSGELFGNSVSGFVRPLGLSVVFGSFIFGVGMQIANGCASGNLYHLGGGQIRAIPVIIGFSGGALWATLDYEWWTSLPQLAPVSLIESFGVIPAILANLAVFAAIYLLTRSFSTSSSHSEGVSAPFWSRLVQGPWPMLWGAIGLALLNFVTLAMLGRPWAVALAYPVWGAKVAEMFSLDLELDFTTYWMQPGRDSALLEPLTADAGSLMNIGVIIGALFAAALAGRFVLNLKITPRQFIGGLIGGVMLGYGATISFGCNIGAFIGGVVSGSLHGWLWIAFALAGSYVGTKLRPLFGHA